MLGQEDIVWITAAIVAFCCGLWLYTRLALNTKRKPPQLMICDGCGENFVTMPAHLCPDCKSRKPIAQ